MMRSSDSDNELTICDKCDVTFFQSVSFNQDRAIDFFIQHGILKEYTHCANCRQVCQLKREQLMFYCGNNVTLKKNKKVCSFKKSAKIGSFIEKTNVAVEVKFKLISVLLHLSPPRTHLIQRELGVNHHTLLQFYSYCREIFANHLIDNSSILGGPQTVVEIIEAKCIKALKNKKTWAFGGVQHDTHKCFLVPVERCDAVTLLDVIEEWISPGTTVVSHCWEKYDCCSHEEYKNLTDNNIVTFKKKITDKYTRAIEGCWRQVRGYKKSYNCFKKVQSMEYLAEFLFKWKYPKHAERLHHYFSAAAVTYPPDC